MKKINIGLLGLGTVGSGVVKMLQDHFEKISKITGRKLIVKKVVVHDISKKRAVNLKDVEISDNPNSVLEDETIQIVVEVMGTIDLAKKYIEKALKAGKNVVTANKDLIALYGVELSKLANKYHRNLYYEASVAGGIPILRTIVNSFAADKIIEVKGIVNGTTNYIMTQMNQAATPYQEALKNAQELGFAEADPTNDVGGFDAAYKMIILTQFAFGKNIQLEDVKIKGIEDIKLNDIKEANRLGYEIKLLGISKLINNHLDVSVGPVLIPKHRPLATVQNENNAVFVTGSAVGETMFYGPGAGELPTANSVLSDIIAVAKNIALDITATSFNDYSADLKLAKASEVIYPYYISLKVTDKLGQMLKITEIMTNHKASFNLITQENFDKDHARITMVTHEMSEEQLLNITEKLSALSGIDVIAAYKVLEK